MKKAKQITAIIAIALLVGLYIATLITAIFAKENAATAFILCLILTFVIPLMAFIAILFFGRASGKKVIGDPVPRPQDDDTSGNSDTYPAEDEEASSESVKDDNIIS